MCESDDYLDHLDECEQCRSTSVSHCPEGAKLLRALDRTMTRAERYQAAADAGIDTWEDYRGER